MYFILNNQQISFDELRNFMRQPIDLKLSAYELDVLKFCFQYLNDVQQFSITTSGSTGQPKPFILSRSLMQWQVKTSAYVIGLHKGMKTLICIPAEKVGGCMMLVRSMELGLPTEVILPVSNPMNHLDANHKFDFTALVPFQLQTILEAGEESIAKLNRFKVILIGGAIIHQTIEDRLQKLQPDFFQTYGMTETASHIALRKLNGNGRQNSFYPLPGVQITQNINGTIQINIPNQPMVSANDNIELHTDGSFNILGRSDWIINSGGVKVQPEKVEAAVDKALTNLKLDFKNYFVCGLPDQKLGQKVSLIFEGEKFSEAEEESLNNGLAEYLGPYEMPRNVKYVPKFLYNASGKPDRLAMIDLLVMMQN